MAYRLDISFLGAIAAYVLSKAEALKTKMDET